MTLALQCLNRRPVAFVRHDDDFLCPSLRAFSRGLTVVAVSVSAVRTEIRMTVLSHMYVQSDTIRIGAATRA